MTTLGSDLYRVEHYIAEHGDCIPPGPILARAGDTALHMAGRHGHIRVVELAVANGQDLDVKRSDGVTPLYLACQEGHLALAELLVGAGADVSAARANGMTPLAAAGLAGHPDIVRMLARAGADVDAAAVDGTTALFVASYEGRVAAVAELLEAKADTDAARNDEATPLFVAALTGNLEVVQLLCSYGAIRTVPTALRPACRRRALERIAEAAGHPKVASFLKETRKWTALCYAHVLEGVIGGAATARVERLLRAGSEPGRAVELAHAHADRAASQLVLTGCGPWSPETHALFPKDARRSAVVALLASSQVAARAGVHQPVLVEQLLPLLVGR